MSEKEVSNKDTNKKETTNVEKPEEVIKKDDQKETIVKNEQKENIVKEEKKETIVKEKKSHIKIILIILIPLLLFAGFISTFFAIMNYKSDKIVRGVKASNIELQGLTKEQAENVIRANLDKYLNKKIVLTNEEIEIEVSPSDFDTEFMVNEAVEKAWSIGNKRKFFVNNFEILNSWIFGTEIEVDYKYNEGKLENIFNEVNTIIKEPLIQPSYYIENDKLIINQGEAGFVIKDREKIIQRIINSLKESGDLKLEFQIIKQNPDKIDIEKIYKEIKSEPKNAYYKEEPFEVFPGANGIDLDINGAKDILQEEKQEYQIALIITKPEITLKEIGTEAFPDVLSSFSTLYYASNISRTKNMQLAAEKINDYILGPGEVFSYNKVVGERTMAKGYSNAPGYVSGKVVPVIGGGICQVSTTLYNAVINANLDIVERKNHMFLPSYITAGKDATVSYGSIDFKFKNTRSYPIVIKMNVDNGVVKSEIYGIKEKQEYEIVLETKILSYIPYKTVNTLDNNLPPGAQRVEQYGMNGSTSVTHKVTKLNGQEIKREEFSRDKYWALDKIVKVGAEPIIEEPVIQPLPVVEEIENPLVLPEAVVEPTE